MAEFKYYLNRQGVRGPQGPQGEKGFSPDISVEKDTLSEYVLRITNEGGYFLTTNLREHKEDRGGTYIRYDRANGVMYAGDAELATTDTLGVIRIAKDEDFAGKAEDTAVTPAQVQDYTAEKVAEVNQRIDSLDATNVKLTGKQTVAGTKTFTDGIVTDRVSLSNGNSVLRPDAGRIKIGSTSNTAGTKLEGPYVEIRGTNVDIYGKFTASGFADFNYNTTFYQDAIIKGSVKDDNNHLYLKQNTITAGDNVQIVNTADGIKISSTAQGDVTLAGDNSFTGNNTFDGVSTFNGDTWVDSLKVGTSLKNQQDKLFLSQSTITAGDNVTIEETTDGVKISSTGGVSIDDGSIANVSTWSSSKINSEITTAVDTINSTKNDNIFDISKFTVVGNPTITEDGIASGFISTGNINTSSFLSCDIGIDFTKRWEITLKANTGGSGRTNLLFFDNKVDNGCYIVGNNNGGSATLLFRVKENSLSVPSLTVQSNTDYIFKIGWDLTRYYINAVKISDGTFNEQSVLSTAPIYEGIGGIKAIGVRYINPDWQWLGSIDLKSFSITVDGEEVFNGLMESTKPIYDKIATTSTALSTFQTDTDNNFSAVNSALNEKANLSDLAGYVTVNKYNELLARVVALEAQIDGGIA